MVNNLVNINIKKLVVDIIEGAKQSNNEEEFRIEFAKLLDPILKLWNIKPSYEKRILGKGLIFSGREDALYGTVIIELKSPGKLSTEKEFEKAKEQIKNYITLEAKTFEYYGKYFGAIIDGYSIGFIRYRRNEWEELGPLDINEDTVRKLLEAIRGLSRKPIDDKFILIDFGPDSEIAKSSIQAFYKALIDTKSPRTMVLFEDWKRVFSQVCAYSTDKLKELINYYDLKNKDNIDVEKLMFSIHTYYTVFMKLLSSEIITFFSDSLIGSYLKRLEESYLSNKSDMKDELKRLEEGGIFKDLGIKNFLEADYFAWYIDEWNDNISDVIYDLVKKLLEYEPATVELTPERVKDLFKKLYQNLIPRDIRHKLGEYFTPDWLAELLLDEIGYDGNPEKRVLDPACGSGTFLVLTIKRIKEYAEEHFLDSREILRKIVKNVQGIDLNPLAVIASKANYIIAIADLIRYRPSGGIEIPIFLADSISVKTRTPIEGGKEIVLNTVVSEFHLPMEIVDKEILSPILDLIDLSINNRYSFNEFKKMIIQKYELNDYTLDSLEKLYSTLLSLENAGKNRIWTRVLKNSSAPLIIGKFDYVVGNPPWINWENLPETYRNESKSLWNDYGLLEKTKGMGLGKVKRDMSMLFLAKSLDKFTKEGGKLAFLIPFTVYKTQTGAGFRKFIAGNEKIHSKILKIHDLVTLFPFESAVNRTSLIIIEKSGKTEIPIQCIMWVNPKSKGINQDLELEKVKNMIQQINLLFVPIEKNKFESPWMQITEKAYEVIKKVIGSSPYYNAYEGINTALNQVYWIKILSKTPDGLLITNPPIAGQKKNVKQIESVVERDLVYPLIRGKDVKKWYIIGEHGWIIVPHNPETGRPIPEEILKIKYPNTYKYFTVYQKTLEERSIQKLLGKGNPFYSVYDIGRYTFYPYKVIWKRISGAITGKAISFASAVIEPFDAKPVILNDSIILIPFERPEEAYYVSGILNSSIALLTIASYTYELRQETHIIKHIKIPKFNLKDPLHLKISELSKKAHNIAKEIYQNNRENLKDELIKIEEEIDTLVAELYEINGEELEEIKKCLIILKGEEIEEEQENNTDED
ncbi:MAG: Eco57I restriction-modification methylase domain-containing protein [Thermoplasmata archaeon]